MGVDVLCGERVRMKEFKRARGRFGVSGRGGVKDVSGFQYIYYYHMMKSSLGPTTKVKPDIDAVRALIYIYL